jgi:hypothetical protein
MIDSFMQPYADAGHDLESLFEPGIYKCARCGQYQIDLSEDLTYGEMSRCIAIVPADAIERLRDYAINKWTDGIGVKDARAILAEFDAMKAENARLREDQIVREHMRAYYISQGLLTVQMPTGAAPAVSKSVHMTISTSRGDA